MKEDPAFRPWGMSLNQFCLFMHLSQLSNFIVPLAGYILPIVMWATNRDQSEEIDQHGKNILNWLISSVIYVFIGILLTFVLIGIPILIAVGLCAVIFAIIGGIKASDGVIYRYPGTITFIR